MSLERDRPPYDREHARRWRRSPFAPARPRRPDVRPNRADEREPRDPRPRNGGGAADSERPPSS